jgi:hypothetical protein
MIPKLVDAVSERIAYATAGFVQTRAGKIFLVLVLVGPLTFLPTLWEAWTAENIDVFRTYTWPALVVINISATLGAIHNGDWRLRLVMIMWSLVFILMFIATLVR